MGVARGRCDRFAGQGIACGPGRCDPDGCGEGIADLSDRLGPDAVHPGEISLGHLRDCSRVTYPAAASACRAWPGQAGRRARAWRGLLAGHAVTRPAR